MFVRAYMFQTYPWQIMESFAPLVWLTIEEMQGRTWYITSAGYYPLDVPTFWRFTLMSSADGTTWTPSIVQIGTPP